MLLSQSDLVLADGQASPVNTTFSTGGAPQADKRLWCARSVNGTYPLGWYRVELSVRLPKDMLNPTAMQRATLKSTEPKLDLTIPAAPKLISSAIISTEFAFPVNWTEADKQNAIARHASNLTLRSANKLGDNVVAMVLPGA